MFDPFDPVIFTNMDLRLKIPGDLRHLRCENWPAGGAFFGFSASFIRSRTELSVLDLDRKHGGAGSSWTGRYFHGMKSGGFHAKIKRILLHRS